MNLIEAIKSGKPFRLDNCEIFTNGGKPIWAISFGEDPFKFYMDVGGYIKLDSLTTDEILSDNYIIIDQNLHNFMRYWENLSNDQKKFMFNKGIKDDLNMSNLC